MNLHRVASRTAACCGMFVLVSCAKTDSKVADSVAVIAPPAGATTATSGGVVAAPLKLTDIAGKWTVRATPQGGTDTTVTVYTLTATGTSEGWKITYANGQVVPVRVTASADSVITDAGPYASVRRKGVQVTTHGAFRKDGDKIVGTTVAHYSTKGADSVLTLHSEGVRAP